MTLMSVVKPTRRAAPVRLLIHSGDGVGKSSFAANAPSPIFAASEDGLSNIDAKAFPEPKDWSTLLSYVDSVARDAHDFKTFVIDSLDWAEPLCWAHVVAKANSPKIKAIEDFGYGKGYVAALDEWRTLLHKLGAVRERGMHVILIAHSIRKTLRNPDTENDFDAWVIKLHEKSAGLIKEWVDVVGFASHDIVTIANKDTGRHKGLATGRRVLKTQPNPAYDAKTRYLLPRSIPLDWSAFENAVRAGSVSPLARLKADFDAKLAELADPEIEKSARAFVAERGDNVGSLSDAIGTVDAYLAERAEKARAAS